jgi:hypothetical protein
MDADPKNDKIELVIVFKKGVTLDEANAMLGNSGVRNYREGMDSSRGKIYFYGTGPKFILTFDTPEEKQTFLSASKGAGIVHEMYTPDWTKRKD